MSGVFAVDIDVGELACSNIYVKKVCIFVAHQCSQVNTPVIMVLCKAIVRFHCDRWVSIQTLFLYIFQDVLNVAENYTDVSIILAALCVRMQELVHCPTADANRTYYYILM